MFRTARGFLLVAPAAFVVALTAFLLAHPKAPEAFAAFPFMSEALGPDVVKHPFLRFELTSIVFFLVPYLVTGLLLFFAELGLGAAAPLWKGKKRSRTAPAGIPGESRWAFLGVSLAVAGWAGASLHHVAHGGELPGGVNVAPLFVAAAAFGAVAVGLLASLVAAIPRALLGGQPAPRVRRAS
jgi:hypothetical protein